MLDATAPLDPYPSAKATPTKPADRIARIAAKIAVTGSLLLALLFVAEFVWAAAHRARYQFDLEWMEGAIVDHVDRLLSGASLYVPPSVDFLIERPGSSA